MFISISYCIPKTTRKYKQEEVFLCVAFSDNKHDVLTCLKGVSLSTKIIPIILDTYYYHYPEFTACVKVVLTFILSKNSKTYQINQFNTRMNIDLNLNSLQKF